MTGEPRYTTQLYYGRLTITHYDDDQMLEIGNAVKDCLAKMGLKYPGTMKVQWIFHRDGVETVSAEMGVNGKWIKPKQQRRLR